MGTREPVAARRAAAELERVLRRRGTLFGDLVGYVVTDGSWWLVPLLVTLMVMSVLAVLAQSPAASLVYTLF